MKRYTESRLRWDDLRFPAQGINPVGGASDPAVISVETTFPGCLSFSGSADNVIAGIAQMPHAWAPGTTVKPHIHWLKPTGSSSAVTWEFYHRIANVDETFPSWTGPVSGTLVAGDQTVSDRHLITSFGGLTMTGKRESTILAWRLYRRGSTDAESNAVTLLEFDIHYQREKGGTVPEYPGA